MPDLAVWPTDGADGAVSSEARWRKMARLWVPSGSVSGLTPALIAGPAITVATGSAWLDGHFAELTAGATVPVSANGLLVLRFTPADNRCELLYRDGASTPTQTEATWELPIARMVAGAMGDIRVSTSPAGVPVVLNLPPFPYDGQQVLYYSGPHAQAFHLVYDSRAPSPYRWVVAGGAPLAANVNGSESQAFTGAGYIDLPTPGPDVLAPLAGLYRVRVGWTGSATVAAQGAMGVGILPAAGATLPFGAVHNIAGAAGGVVVTGVVEQTYDLTAAQLVGDAGGGQKYATLRARYFTAAGTVAYSLRQISAMPFRVG